MQKRSHIFIGIIGKTHGVNNARNPIAIENKINEKNPLLICSSKNDTFSFFAYLKDLLS